MVNVENVNDLTLLDLCNYGEDAAVIMNEVELKELCLALTDWIEHNDIVKVQTVARINTAISNYLKK